MISSRIFLDEFFQTSLSRDTVLAMKLYCTPRVLIILNSLRQRLRNRNFAHLKDTRGTLAKRCGVMQDFLAVYDFTIASADELRYLA